MGTSPQHIIVKADPDILRKKLKHLPKLGTKVVDAKMNYIGRIHDIFGPVSKFYISIKPKNTQVLSSFSSNLNQPVYIAPSQRKKHSKRRTRRKKRTNKRGDHRIKYNPRKKKN